MEANKEPEKYGDYTIVDLSENFDLRMLDELVYLLERHAKNGTKTCYRIKSKTKDGKDKILYPGIEHDVAWNLVGGMPIDEYNKRKAAKIDLEDHIKNRRDYMPADDKRRIDYFKDYRNIMDDGKEIKEENVVYGLKFIAENPDISQDDLVKGLVDRGCVFTINDIYAVEGQPYSVEKFRDGYLNAGAYVVANSRDSEDSRKEMIERHFTIDDDNSAYHFIRKHGDPNYTKAYVDSLNKRKKSK